MELPSLVSTGEFTFELTPLPLLSFCCTLPLPVVGVPMGMPRRRQHFNSAGMSEGEFLLVRTNAALASLALPALARYGRSETSLPTPTLHRR